jgi:hypothetical protein
MKVGDQVIIAPYGLFRPQLFGRRTGGGSLVEMRRDREILPEDMVLGIDSTNEHVFQLLVIWLFLFPRCVCFGFRGVFLFCFGLS